MKRPSRPSSGAPQLRQVIWRSTDTAPASVRTILYWAPQLGQSNVLSARWSPLRKGHTPAMPRKKQKLIMAAHRVAEARRMIANFNDRIVTLEGLRTTYARS